MPLKCTAEGCAALAIASLDENWVCRAHFLSEAYGRLESIASQVLEPDFHSRHGELATRFLEQCMREVANIACASELPNNLERAQLLDILLWASELYGRLRRGSRVRANIPMVIRSQDEHNPWEEKTETIQLSVHGFSFLCHHELRVNDALACTRLDNGRRAAGRVAWARSSASGGTEAGVEFMVQEDFWGMEAAVDSPVLQVPVTRGPRT